MSWHKACRLLYWLESVTKTAVQIGSGKLGFWSSDWDRTTTSASLLHEQLEFCKQESLISDKSFNFFKLKKGVSSQQISLSCETDTSAVP